MSGGLFASIAQAYCVDYDFSPCGIILLGRTTSASGSAITNSHPASWPLIKLTRLGAYCVHLSAGQTARFNEIIREP